MATAISEDLATDIDIMIAVWCQRCGINDISWNDRCALRKVIYDLLMASHGAHSPERCVPLNEGGDMWNIGDKVTYQTPYKTERGIIKSLSDKQYVFVVYHCNDDWKNCGNYTAERTAIADLVDGWI